VVPEVKIDPASRLLVLATRERSSDSSNPGLEGGLGRAVREIRDWDSVLSLATRHRVAAYLSRSARCFGLPIPRETASTLQRVLLLNAANRLRLESELARVVDACFAASVRTLVLKGPGLARTIYTGRDLRPYSDIDLTISEGDEAAALSAFEALGYVEEAYEAEVARQAHVSHDHGHASFHRMFRSADGAVLVELHLDPLQLGMRPTREAERWQRAQPLPGVPGALMLGWEDQVVQLSVHAHKHGWDRLIWLKDVDLLLRAHGGSLDWEIVRQTAHAEGVSASVWYTLRLVRTLLGTPVPGAVLASFRPVWPIQLAYRWVWPTERIANLGAHMRRRSVQFHAAESWRGMVPSTVLMGRRTERARLLVSALGYNWSAPKAACSR
jgi:hypothetical protein